MKLKEIEDVPEHKRFIEVDYDHYMKLLAIAKASKDLCRDLPSSVCVDVKRALRELEKSDNN